MLRVLAMEQWIGYGREQAEAHPVAVAVTLAILVANALILIWWHHPLYGSNIGPPVLPILGSITLLLKSRDHFLETTVELIKKSPTHTIRFVRPGGTAVYSTAHVENVEYILKTRFENFVKGEYLGTMLGDLLGNGIFNVDGHLWKLQRKLASHEFTSRSLRGFAFDCADRELRERLVPILTTHSSNAAIVDLQDLFLRFNFDIICQLGFGIDPHYLSPSLPAVRFADAFDAATELSVKRFGMLPITRSLRQYFNLGSERKLRETVAIVNEIAHGVIQARREEFKKTNASLREDLLSRFMRFTDSQEVVGQSELEQKVMHDLKLRENEEASDVFLRDIVISFVLAGRDSISSALSWFFLLLAQNPRVEAKLVEEIRASAGGFSFEELKQLHYLNGAVHESLRLFPPVPLDTKMAVRDDVLPDGTVVRAGDRVSYNIFAMARMPGIWGEDCDEFKPERWLGEDGVFVQESSFKFAAFQAGPRICLGKELALIQIKQVAAKVIDKFEIEVLNKHPPLTYRNIVLRMHNGLPVRVHARAR